ncbi:MAG: hypothetical protein QG601_222 [Pseudomonadota bacterium]|jgi:hypothetical protein|nr:hypothetical protein [Pseudomonadota bacterium]
MSWAEAMKENAKAASRHRVSADAIVLRSAPATSWDLDEVWLTRVKQPHERAADRYTASAEYLVRRLPD